LEKEEGNAAFAAIVKILISELTLEFAPGQIVFLRSAKSPSLP
jgi:hypothetical protein